MKHRRGKFGLLAMLLGAAGVLASCSPSASAPSSASSVTPAWRQGLAVQLFSFNKDLAKDLPGTLARIKALGFDKVETYQLRGVSAAELRAALDAAGLRAVSAHIGYDRIRDDLAGAVADAKALGVEQFGPAAIRFGGASQYLTAEEADAAGAVLARGCAAARAAGMTLLLHLHGNELKPFADGKTPLDRMIDAAGGCFTIEADIYWVQWAGVDPVALIERYGSRVGSLHVKDMGPGGMGGQIGRIPPEGFPPLGKGSMDIAGVIRVSKKVGVRHYVLEDESGSPDAQIPVSLAYLNSLPN